MVLDATNTNSVTALVLDVTIYLREIVVVRRVKLIAV